MNIKKKKIKNIKFDKKITIIIIITLIFLAILPVSISRIMQARMLAEKEEDLPLISYKVNSIDSKNEELCNITITFYSANGFETIKHDGSTINCNNKKKVAIDYVALDGQDYEFTLKQNKMVEQTETMHFEIPRIKGNYTLSNGIYVYEPDVSTYNSDFTRYLSLNANGVLEPGNWIKDEKPTNWYDYKNSNWANIIVENNGASVYYVWIPRYCFKLDQTTQRADVKFIDVYNNYTDENGNVTKWKDLKALGYQVPIAFTFNGTYIPGYWMMKYTAGDVSSYPVDYESIASKTKVFIKGITTNTTETISKYTYAINGKIVHEPTSAEDYTYDKESDASEDEAYVVNVTALGAKGEIIGSMTKTVKTAKVNNPDLTGFNKDTTFYVTYDSSGNEHSNIPLTETAPDNWYDYADSKWANIVTRNNGLETYYVWIPRYEFKLNQVSQRSYINFIEGTGTSTSAGYQIPEAFTFNGTQLRGYWIMKYTAG